MAQSDLADRCTRNEMKEAKSLCEKLLQCGIPIMHSGLHFVMGRICKKLDMKFDALLHFDVYLSSGHKNFVDETCSMLMELGL